MIPKIIHYCWFGRGEKSKLIQKCIDSWHTFFPDYRLIEWNEDNCDISSMPRYVQEAYSVKKYAFVSDYIRIKALVEYGGIYVDTDYEVLKPMDEILKSGALITGFESKESILTAFIAAEPQNEILKEFQSSYIERSFLSTDGKNADLTPINVEFSKLLEKNGINLACNKYQKVGDIVVYPTEVLCGFDVNNWHEKITEKTMGVHHMGCSWANDKMKRHIKRIHFFQKLLGYKLYDKIKALFGGNDE